MHTRCIKEVFINKKAEVLGVQQEILLINNLYINYNTIVRVFLFSLSKVQSTYLTAKEY